MLNHTSSPACGCSRLTTSMRSPLAFTSIVRLPGTPTATDESEEERAADREGARVADSLRAFAERRLAALDRALALAAEGRLTACERCGKRIAMARLQALPGATTCVACARAAEA